jgi:hypothetical protein
MRPIEIAVALGVLVATLAAVQGTVRVAVYHAGVGEDVLDAQQQARVALERFADEARWARLVGDQTFFVRAPVEALPPCTGPNCPPAVTLEVARDNPHIAGCAYYVRFAYEPATRTLTRHIKPDPTQGVTSGAPACVATGPLVVAALVEAVAFEYCDTAGVCTPERSAVSPARVARLRGRIVVAHPGADPARQRIAVSDAPLRGFAPPSPTRTPPASP